MGISGHTVTGLVLLALTPAVGAQVPIATWDGQLPEVGFGSVIAGAGDVNGDGVPDVIVGAPNSQGLRGAARVVSGADGSTLYAFTNSAPIGKPLEELGASVAGCGDLDGDGLAEFAVGQPVVNSLDIGGRARVYRGSDGSVLYDFAATSKFQLMGAAIANTGDLDGDGVDDLAVGASESDAVSPDAGAVFLYSGATGALLTTYGGPETSELSHYGGVLANAGDMNLDGWPDLIVAAPTYGVVESNTGSVWVRSGFTGSVLLHKSGHANDFFGSAVAGGLDVNGSGTPDVLVGAPEFNGLFSFGAGYVQLFEGSTDGSLAELHGVGPNQRGAAVALADVNLDGYADLLVGEPLWPGAAGQFSAGRVLVLSGVDQSLLAQAVGGASAEQAGLGVAAVGDMDGDLASEWAVGAPGHAPMGQVNLYASTSAWQDVGSALAGTGGAPQVTAVGSLQPLSPLTLTLAGGPPYAATTLVAGVSSLFAPFKGGVLVPSPDVLLPGLPLDNDGDLVLPSVWPTGFPSGFSFWLQFWTPDSGAPKGLSASNGLQGTTP